VLHQIFAPHPLLALRATRSARWSMAPPVSALRTLLTGRARSARGGRTGNQEAIKSTRKIVLVRNQQKKKGREEEYFGLKKKQVLLAPQGKEEKGVFDLWLDDPIGATQRLARDGHISPRPLPAIESVALGTI
jgi:hypothetical protein